MSYNLFRKRRFTMAALPDRKYTVEEYIELFKNSDERFEYFDGEIVSMAAGKAAHEDIASNLIFNLRDKLKERSCRIAGGGLAIKTVKAPPFRLADVSVVCGERIIEEMLGIEMLVNPLLIIEVLSPSTAEYDRDRKFIAYKSIESFREYLLVVQERAHVIQYVRQPNDKWLRDDIIGLESEVRLESVGITLSLKDIYEMVVFPQPETGDPGSALVKLSG
ncbi:MAG: Uma2 family endonuclease [Acidobacteriota bacterium]